MRIIIDMPDGLYRRLKARAATEGKPAKTLILEAAENALTSDRSTGRKIVIPVVRSKRPGSLQLDSARIYDVIGFP